DAESKVSVIITGKVCRIVTDVDNGLAIFSKRRIAGMQIVEPQQYTLLLIQSGVAEAIVQGVEVAAEKFRKINRFHHSAQDGRPAARTITIDHKRRNPLVLSPLYCLFPGNGRSI